MGKRAQERGTGGSGHPEQAADDAGGGEKRRRSAASAAAPVTAPSKQKAEGGRRVVGQHSAVKAKAGGKPVNKKRMSL